MKRLFAFILFFSGLYSLAWAFWGQQELPKLLNKGQTKAQLKDLGAITRTPKHKAHKSPPWPFGQAGLAESPPPSFKRHKGHAYGVCRDSFGQIHRAPSSHYDDCINNEAPYANRGRFHSKSAGMLFILP
jgi:hypothetical protein